MCPSIQLFGLTLPTFGLMMMTGLLSAFALLHFQRRHIAITEDDFYSVAIMAILFGMLGSKLLYWIVEIDEVIADPTYILRTLTVGMVFYGSLIGGIGGIALFCLKKKQPLLQYVDLISPAMVLGQAFGRIGCFLAGCCYGMPSDSCLAVTYPAGVGSAAPSGIALLPTQLFESAFCFVLAAVLAIIFRKQKKLGTTTGCYFILYGVWRFIIEFFRSDDRGAVGALSTSQFIGIFIVLIGILLLLLVKKGKTPAHQKDFPEEAEEDGAAEIIEVELEADDAFAAAFGPVAETSEADGETEAAAEKTEEAESGN